MPTAPSQETIDELIGKAGASLASRLFFEAERIAGKALRMARRNEDWGRMIRILPLLREARRGRFDLALAEERLTVVEGPITESVPINPGCYLIQPPLVGADARRLRLAALQCEVPAAVICREPQTKLKQWPIVAVGTGFTVRTRLAPPKNQSKPDLEWFAGAMEDLGEWAIITIDPAMEVRRRIDVLLDRLDAIPESDGLHQAQEDACRMAMDAGKSAEENAGAATRSPGRSGPRAEMRT